MSLASIAPSTPAQNDLSAFFAKTMEPERGGHAFEVVDHRLVRIEVDDFVWIKRGTVIAYHGDMTFRLEQILQSEAVRWSAGPVRSAMKREVVPLSKAQGPGIVFLSDEGKYNRVLRLTGQPICIASSYLLAFEPSLLHTVRMLGGVGVLAGGIFMVELSGTGAMAISIKGDPLTLRVTPDRPVSTDPSATVGWTSGLWPELKTDFEMRTLVAHGGGEPIQMLFRGNGHVIVNARSRSEAMRANFVRRIASKIVALFA
jgi:uncharacterized protein (AIM24 family)